MIIDDINALGFKNDTEAEAFLYQAKEIVNRKGSVVLFLYYIPQNSRRMDKRPMRGDLQFDSLYRLCDIVQFLYRDKKVYDHEEKNYAEIILAKNGKKDINLVPVIEIETL